MAAAANMPNIQSGKIMQISELESWRPDDIHGNAVRVLGRVRRVDVLANTIIIEYHGKLLAIDGSLLGDYGQFRPGMLFQFLGELERVAGKLLLKARICRDMTGLDSDVYDRCLKVRRDFENKIIKDMASQSK